MTYSPLAEVAVQLAPTTSRVDVNRFVAALLADVTTSDPEDEDRAGKPDDNPYRWGVYASVRVEIYGGRR